MVLYAFRVFVSLHAEFNKPFGKHFPDTFFSDYYDPSH